MQAALSNINVAKLSRLLPWLGAAVLLVGVGVYLHSRGSHLAAQRDTANAQAKASYKPAPKLKSVTLDRAARLTAGKFIIDAVQRKNLAEAWKLSAPELKAGMTYKQWMTGNIPVTPFPGPIASAPLKVDVSQPTKALLEVAIVPKFKKDASSAGVFSLNMRTIGTGKAKKWVVVSWVTRYVPPIPATPGS
jgi:hypothetical protein